MTEPTPVEFIHGFIGTFDVRGWHVPDCALARCAGFDAIAGRGYLIPAERPDAFRDAIGRIVCAPPA
ncbi:hypothetical protein [Burkholderia sp. BCC1999]|uniref:hypothetical protein n=1 Tax=Burkholderia sp. BCC1999 TaxID=2817448 RepID=UPI0039F5596F